MVLTIALTIMTGTTDIGITATIIRIAKLSRLAFGQADKFTRHVVL
jgi:hypothetical protein